VTLLSGRPTTGRSTRRGLGIRDRLAALDDVVELARGRMDSAAVADAERVAGKAGERLRFGEDHTVVALAGATGSGKSSLFNALAGDAVSQVGLRRPTTGVAHAAVWGGQDAGALLDWLDVPRRHLVGTSSGTLDGLVLLDLPDVDSVEHSHRLEADRLVERVDLLVWVLDPQKYADAAVHDRYLAPLAGHAHVMLVVLNQVDRLSPAARTGCLADLGRLLDDEGLGEVPVVPASARTGEGLEALRSELARRVAAKRAAVSRLEADLVSVAETLDDGCGGSSASGVGRPEREALVRALTEAAGADLVVDAVAANHRLRARQATGWPFTRWLSRVRRDPARRFRLRATPSELVRTSLPSPSAVQRARVDTALRDLGEQASAGLPDPWPVVVRSAATRSRPELPDLLDRAVAGTDLEIGRRPWWWRMVGVLQLLLAAVTLVGLLWLAALFGVAWLQLPAPPLPHVGEVPLPTVLLIGGVVLGLVLALVSGGFARTGAQASRRRVRRRLEERVRGVADEAVVAPVERELEAHTQLCRALERVRGTR
jgi:GTP-binding protein EngB required for normal cell division